MDIFEANRKSELQHLKPTAKKQTSLKTIHDTGGKKSSFSIYKYIRLTSTGWMFQPVMGPLDFSQNAMAKTTSTYAAATRTGKHFTSVVVEPTQPIWKIYALDSQIELCKKPF